MLLSTQDKPFPVSENRIASRSKAVEYKTLELKGSNFDLLGKQHFSWHFLVFTIASHRSQTAVISYPIVTKRRYTRTINWHKIKGLIFDQHLTLTPSKGPDLGYAAKL